FYATIEAEIAQSKKVVVLWSQKSVTSGWVLSEAQEGVERQKLCPVRLDECKPPMGFRHLHASALDDVKRDMREFLVSLGLLDRPDALVLPPPTSQSASQPADAVEDAAIYECDLLAGDPDDPAHTGPGVKLNDLKPARAIPACQLAVKQHPSVARFKYQL